MRIYLAARYSRRLELSRWAEDLRAAGHVVTSRWLDGNYQAHPSDPGGDKERFAVEDLHDLCRAEAVIAFTEQSRSGGRCL